MAPAPHLRHAPFALTEIQQAYWVGRQEGFDLGQVAAHGYMEVDAAQADPQRLESAFNRLIVRHDMLRAVVQGDGRQRILREVPHYAFRTYDLADADPAQREDHLQRIREEMSHQVLDCTTWPLFDVRVTRLGGAGIRLHLSLDVLIFDASSFDILSEEWARFYNEPNCDLAPLELSYADYVRGLEQVEQTELYRSAQRYWRERLDTLPPAPALPLARPPASVHEPRFTRRSGQLDALAWQGFKRSAQRHGVTPSMALATAYAYAIARWSQSRRFTLSLTLFNRLPLHPQVDRLVGDFTSIVPLEVDLTKRLTFAEHARRIQAQLWEDMDHRYVSGVRVVRELVERRRDPSAGQLPVVMTSAIDPLGANAPAAMRWLGEIAYTITQTPQVWLDHQVTEDAGSLLYDWDAVEELFPAGLLDDLFGAYSSLLDELVRSPGAWERSEADLRPAAQRELIGTVNATAVPAPRGLLHEPILEQCRSSPHSLAVIADGMTLTYAELERDANRVAHALWRQGLATGELVAVLLPKSRHQVVAVLGILEAGGAYLPIEAGYPDERIAQILGLAGATRVLSTAAVLQERRLPAGTQTLLLDQLESQAHVPAALPALQQPDDIAYVIYTSGSTGTPKGVAIDHHGALNTVIDINRRFGVTQSDRVLSLSALNFDLSVWDIFGVLAAGGAVVLPDSARLHEPAHWAQLMAGHAVTLWNTVPALMDIYVDYLAKVASHADDGLRLAMLSGDWIPVQLPDAIRTWCPHAKVVSLGGATEASIWSIFYPIDAVDPQWRSIPYGKPLANQTMHVLDEAGQPCPVWVPGEIHIGGIGLAREYWRDPERTAQSFVRQPGTGQRLYRTGDLGRYLLDGNIEFLGRKDFQVKVNGFRVELGEIEAQLARCADVQGAVVALAGAPGEAKQLVGYYVKQAAAHDSGKLRFRLSQPGVRRFATDALSVALPAAATDDCARRRSRRVFGAQPLPLAQLAAWLEVLRQGQHLGLPKYRYGSPGSLYPVQAYVFASPGRVDGLDAGLYYYHPVEHALVPVSVQGRIDGSHFPPENTAIVQGSAVQVFLVADLDAIEPIYGADSERLSLLEAGAIAHLLEERAADLGLAACQLGGFDFARNWPLFALERKCAYLHSVGAGLAPTAEQEAAAALAPAEETDQQFGERLAAALREKLPAYMVPSAFVRLEQLPLSSNGKIDRKALPAPQRPRSEPRATVAPGSELARAVCRAWEEVLGRPTVGVEDNFFDLGGTSVDMIKIHTLLQPRLPRPVSLLDMFFTHPTIASLVAHLEGAAAERAAAPASARSRVAIASQRSRRSGARQQTAL